MMLFGVFWVFFSKTSRITTYSDKQRALELMGSDLFKPICQTLKLPGSVSGDLPGMQ